MKMIDFTAKIIYADECYKELYRLQDLEAKDALTDDDKEYYYALKDLCENFGDADYAIASDYFLEYIKDKYIELHYNTDFTKSPYNWINWDKVADDEACYYCQYDVNIDRVRYTFYINAC